MALYGTTAALPPLKVIVPATVVQAKLHSLAMHVQQFKAILDIQGHFMHKDKYVNEPTAVEHM